MKVIAKKKVKFFFKKYETIVRKDNRPEGKFAVHFSDEKGMFLVC